MSRHDSRFADSVTRLFQRSKSRIRLKQKLDLLHHGSHIRTKSASDWADNADKGQSRIISNLISEYFDLIIFGFVQFRENQAEFFYPNLV